MLNKCFTTEPGLHPSSRAGDLITEPGPQPASRAGGLTSELGPQPASRAGDKGRSLLFPA